MNGFHLKRGHFSSLQVCQDNHVWRARAHARGQSGGNVLLRFSVSNSANLVPVSVSTATEQSSCSVQSDCTVPNIVWVVCVVCKPRWRLRNRSASTKHGNCRSTSCIALRRTRSLTTRRSRSVRGACIASSCAPFAWIC